MARRLDLQDADVKLSVRREDDENAFVTLTVEADGMEIAIRVGRWQEDAQGLARTLREASSEVDDIVSEWVDVPDADSDGFVFADRGRYSIRLEGVDYPAAYPSKEIATYELAAAMTKTGCFPAAWFEGPGSYGTFELDSAVRAFHDEGGTDLLPLEGVEYEPGDELVFGEGHPWSGSGAEVVRDYGTMGIHVLVGDGEPYLIEHDDRGKVSRYVDADV